MFLDFTSHWAKSLGLETQSEEAGQVGFMLWKGVRTWDGLMLFLVSGCHVFRCLMSR